MARSAPSHGLQHWLESKAAGPAFLVAGAAVILRGAPFWSGGAINLTRLLGATGVAWLDGLTGIGIAVGAELMASVFGRQWQRAEAERLEAATRPRLSKADRAQLAAHYTGQARIAKRFMFVGMAASAIAASFFLLTTTGAHDVLAVGGELLIAAVLVTVMTAFGVFYHDRPDQDAAELQAGQARTMRSRAVDSAGDRIARGDYTPQDVRLVSSALPRAERDQFEAALIAESPDDPAWSTAQLAGWLGCDDQAGRRRLVRQLGKLHAAGVGVVKDDRTGYRVPRSVVAMYFAEQYLASHAPAKATTPASHSRPSGPFAATATRDADTTPTGERQAPESTASVSPALA